MDNEYNNQNESGRATSLHERVRQRSLGDIRIHDSAQAGELARRLGARAFTVGRDIYVRPELVNPATPQGEALLAHEATHALEQSGSSASDMPLLHPHLGKGGPGGGASPVQRATAGASAPASLPSSEVAAEASEASTLQSAQASQSQGGGQSGQQQSERSSAQADQQPDAEEVAERVYALMLHEMIIDIERNAHL